MAKQPDNLATGKVNITTQKYLDIAEIKENLVILRDGSMRSVLMVSSINFALKSEDEQNALIAAYITFLNSIDFPLQIVIQSRELDLTGYLAELKEREKEQTNELLKIQMTEHISYIEELVSIGKIMNKRFYTVVPYFSSVANKNKNFFNSLSDVFKPAVLLKMKGKVFLQRKEQLEKRTGIVIRGLGSIGLNVVPLDTQALIELYYNSYNPVTGANERMGKKEELRVI